MNKSAVSFISKFLSAVRLAFVFNVYDVFTVFFGNVKNYVGVITHA